MGFLKKLTQTVAPSNQGIGAGVGWSIADKLKGTAQTVAPSNQDILKPKNELKPTVSTLQEQAMQSIPRVNPYAVTASANSIKHGFFKINKPVKELTREEFGNAIDDEIRANPEGFKRAFLKLNIVAEPTAENIALAYVKYGKTLADVLNEYAPIGGRVGAEVSKAAAQLATENMAAFEGNLYLNNQEKAEAGYVAADVPKDKKESWVKSFDWGGALGGLGSIITAVQNKPTTGAQQSGNNNTNTPNPPQGGASDKIMGIPKTMFFAGIVVVVLGLVLYFASKNGGK